MLENVDQEDIDNEVLNDDEESLFEHYRIAVDKGQQLIRVDKYLNEKLPHVSRNKIQNAIDQGFIKVNDQSIKVNYKVKPFDSILIALPEARREYELTSENIPLNIIYEDDDLLVVNKPAGMVVHPANGHWTGTLVNGLIYHLDNLPNSNGKIRPGLVHRIDKNTSGLVLIAKNDHAMTYLAKQFFDHTVERTYYALVWGRLKEDKGTIVGHIGRSMKDRKMFEAYVDGSHGKHAVTHYKLLRIIGNTSLVQCNLETGRTHQIRVHFKHMGHPLFADETYGGYKIVAGQVFTRYKQFVENTFKVMPRQALHAKTLGFVHPTTKEFVQFDSELPADFQAAIARWEDYANQKHIDG